MIPELFLLIDVTCNDAMSPDRPTQFTSHPGGQSCASKVWSSGVIEHAGTLSDTAHSREVHQGPKTYKADSIKTCWIWALMCVKNFKMTFAFDLDNPWLGIYFLCR